MASHNLGVRDRHEIKELLAKLDAPLTMSMFLKREDLEEELYKQRQQAAKLLRRILET